MLKKKLLLIIIFLLLISTVLKSNKLEFSHNLTIYDGLSHNGITSILEDSKGYIWISTFDGLNRYDGYSFKVFKNTVEKEILISNRIRTIKENNVGHIWIGTDDGISIFDPATEKFKNIYSNKMIGNDLKGPSVLKFIFSKNNQKIICLSEYDGVLIFDNNYILKGKHKPQKYKNVDNIKFYDGIELNNNIYLLCSSQGLYLFEQNTGKFFPILKSKIYNCNSILKISEESFLVTTSEGVVIFDFNLKNNTHNFKFINHVFKTEIFNGASIDTNGNLWLTTLREGLILLKNVKTLRNNSNFNTAHFNTNSGLIRLSCVISTTKSGCWVGSFDKGIYRFHLNENPFGHCHTDLQKKHGLSSNEISSITPYDENRAFISTINGKLTLFNTLTKDFEPLPSDLQKNTNIQSMKSFFHDSKHNIWFINMNNNGLYVLKNNSNTLTKIQGTMKLDSAHVFPRYATEDKHGNLWIATANDVLKINLDANQNIVSTESLNDNPLFKTRKIYLVRFIYADPLYDYIWVGTDFDGLIRIDLKENVKLSELITRKFTHNKNIKNSISSDFVTSIIRLPNKDLWIGTERGGICKVINSNKNPEFICFSEKDGLSNNVVKRIIYDNKNNLWVSTNIGLNKFDLTTQQFRIFRRHEGIPFEDFTFSGRILPNGTILLGGMNGLCYFNPKDISSNESLPDLQFGELKIFNNTVAPGDSLQNRVLYKQRLSNNDVLKLKYNEAIFSIELQSLHYSTPENHYIKYKLSPINKTWIEIPSNQRIINYSGLQPGDYILQVMASNSLNEWTEPIELKISISPPYWKTIPAYIIYFILIVAILYIIFFFILRIYTLNHSLEIEKLEKDKIREINNAKINVFANISHEIKTPLTLISGPLKLLAERFRGNSDISEKLNMVQRQSKKLALLVDQMHEFQLDDANQLKMYKSEFFFNSFIKEIMMDFKIMAETEKKNLFIELEDEEIYVDADKDKLEKIINNILNNSFKHTKANDSIKIYCSKNNNELFINIADTGHGIDKEDLPHIFERFYQSKNKKNATVGGYGIGLTFSKRLIEMHNGNISVESEKGDGARFHVILPIVIEKPKNIELLNEQDVLRNEIKQQMLGYNHETTKINRIGDYSSSLIYVVEDNIEIQNFIVSSLSNLFKIKSFTNGVECLKAMEEVWPDLVLSDVLMPEMNGLELCKRIKTDLKTSHIPVILLTAFDAVQDQIKGLVEGADAYITKPFDMQHLVTQIEVLLTNRKQLRDRFLVDIPLTFSNEKNLHLDNEFLEKLYQLMSENLDNQDLDIDNFAKELYLNRSYFYQKVKALTNQTPFELLKMYRLKKAAEMLIQKEVSVNDVYLMTGFKSRTHFSKIFKEVYNVTPGKYASEMEEKYKETNK